MNAAESVVRQRFQEFYMNVRSPLFLPNGAPQREYGFLLFKEKFMVRHRSFKTSEAVIQAIRDLVPKHVYYSTAYYANPTAPMDEKGWSGADLVFDIDADHLETPCKKIHDTWTCKQCGNAGRGTAIKPCPKCKSEKIEEETWLCEQCLQQAKEETLKLLEKLTTIGPDVGIEPGNVKVFFSGHRGYHVHVISKDLSVLTEDGRKEIVDYVLGLGFDPDSHLKIKRVSSFTDPGIFGTTQVIAGPRAEDPGWRGKIAMGVYEDKSLTESDRDKFLERPGWSLLGSTKSKSVLVKAADRWTAFIDTVVTTDTHRLIRLPGTLNGHTGLLAASVKLENLDDFDPFIEAVAFKRKMKIHVKEAPAFKLGGEKLGPFHNESVEVPEAAAILLLCKHRAEPDSK